MPPGSCGISICVGTLTLRVPLKWSSASAGSLLHSQAHPLWHKLQQLEQSPCSCQSWEPRINHQIDSASLGVQVLLQEQGATGIAFTHLSNTQ